MRTIIVGVSAAIGGNLTACVGRWDASRHIVRRAFPGEHHSMMRPVDDAARQASRFPGALAAAAGR
jgi:hypothetical protein